MDLFKEKHFNVVLAGFPLAALMGYYGLEIATASCFYQDKQNLEILKAYGTLVSSLGFCIIFFFAYVSGIVFLKFSGMLWKWREKRHRISSSENDLRGLILLFAIFLCSVTALLTNFVYRAYFQGMPIQFGLGVISCACIIFLVAKRLENAILK